MKHAVQLAAIVGLAIFSGAASAAPPAITNAILFVTQVPLTNEIKDGTASNVTVSVGSAFGNHLADTAHAGRGGDLWVRYGRSMSPKGSPLRSLLARRTAACREKAPRRIE